MTESSGPCIVQSDLTVLLEVDHPQFEFARDVLMRFSELVKSPDRMHTYRISPLSLWNAAASGQTVEWVLSSLEKISRYPLPPSARNEISDFMRRFGQLTLQKRDEQTLELLSTDPLLLKRFENTESLRPYFSGRTAENNLLVAARHRGQIKHLLIKLGWPVKDLAGYIDGAALPVELRSPDLLGRSFSLRDYQTNSVHSFLGAASDVVAKNELGSGVVVLPCGAGKTVVGIGVLQRLQCQTLILVANILAARQWKTEILNKTTLSDIEIGEYSGERKEIRPITIATYQVITHVGGKDQTQSHFDVFNRENWGLIIYDEVHMLPAPVFQMTASLQARRRLGLTATLVREDGKEDDVFSLIGPKRFDMPWKTLEENGWIAQAHCFEIRVPFDTDQMVAYVTEEDDKKRFRFSADNPSKRAVVSQLLDRHRDDNVLVIGQYLDGLTKLAEELKLPLVTGKTPTKMREKIFQEFRAGQIRHLAVSSIANIALDLPDANCAIQISGRFGSRQEEAQRLGRILRPKPGSNKATFYTLVTQDTDEQQFARHRQLFLAEQGYRYTVMPAHALNPTASAAPLNK